MEEFLKKIKLIEYLTTDIEIHKSEFVSKFEQQVDEGSTGMFFDAFDIFSSSKNVYKGHVGYEGFKIKRRKKFFDMNMNLAVATGTYRQSNEKLIIETEITGFSKMMIPFYLFVILFYLVFIGAMFMTGNNEGGFSLIFMPFIFIHAVFMLGIPYLMMRRSVKKMKHELEREFYYMTKA